MPHTPHIYIYMFRERSSCRPTSQLGLRFLANTNSCNVKGNLQSCKAGIQQYRNAS